MSKKFKVILLILAMAVTISLLAPPASASFWLKGMGFHYSPDYGDLGDTLEEKALVYETPKKLKAGSGFAFSSGYDFSKNWGIRLDSFSFTGIADYHHPASMVLIKTSTSPILLSGIYRIQNQNKWHPYFGVGIGIFRSEFTATKVVWGHLIEEFQTDSPIGFQWLLGIEYRLEGGLLFSGELRYLSAKTEYPAFQCIEDSSTDWSGIFFSIGIGYRFSSPKVEYEF